MEIVGVKAVTASDGKTTAIAVASTATVYTHSFKLSFGRYFSVAYLAASSGTPDLKIEWESAFQEPATEGAADTYWSEPENMQDIEANLTTKTIHRKSISPIVDIYGRFKITGNAGNPADTTLNLWIGQQEQF